MTKNLAAFAIFPLALAYSGITAPFRGADEYNHFFRAYHVSIGRMIARHAAFGVVGEELPASLLILARAAAVFPRLPSIASSSAQLRAAIAFHWIPIELRSSIFRIARFTPL
jgi:hypothetical protein